MNLSFLFYLWSLERPLGTPEDTLPLFTSHCSHPATKEGRNVVSSHVATCQAKFRVSHTEEEGGEEERLDTGEHLVVSNLKNEKRLLHIANPEVYKSRIPEIL